MNRILYGLFFLFSFISITNAATTPGVTVDEGDTQVFDNISDPGLVTTNYQKVDKTVSYNTIDSDGNVVANSYAYKDYEKLNVAKPWVITTGGISDYLHEKSYYANVPCCTDVSVSASAGAILNNGTLTTNDVIFANNQLTANIDLYSAGHPFFRVSLSGGAIYNKGLWGTDGNENETIKASFVNNGIKAVNTGNSRSYSRTSLYGGAIYNSGKIGHLVGDFVSNYVSSNALYANGGAVYNSGSIASITGDFIDNSTTLDSQNLSYDADFILSAGAIYNSSYIGSIKGNFINNYTYLLYTKNGAIYGGTLVNSGYGNIDSIEGNAIGNYAYSKAKTGAAVGGFLYNTGIIGDVNVNFINNYAQAASTTAGHYAYGGAVYNSKNIKNLAGYFIGNYTDGGITPSSYGGAIYVAGGLISNISGKFINNYATISSTSTSSYALGGAIYVTNGSIGDIDGYFVGNKVVTTKSASTHGGAIYNVSSIGNLTSDFIENFGYSLSNNAYGGAIYNGGTIGTTNANPDLDIGISGNFINNSAKTSSISNTIYALGGAIYTTKDLTFTADGQDNFFTGNFTEDSRGKIYNSIFVLTSNTSSPILTFDIKNNGNIIIDDNIFGANRSGNNLNYTYQYNIDIVGDTTGKFFMNNDIINVGNVKVTNSMLIFGEGAYGKGAFKRDPAGSNTSLTNLTLTNGQFYLHNDYFEKIGLRNYTAVGDNYLHINVGKENGKWVSDVLNIMGDINGNGQTNVVVYDSNKNDNTDASVLFVSAPSDVILNKNAFKVYRVYGSPYMWEAKHNYKGETLGSYWYLVNETTEDNKYAEVTPDPISPSSPPTLPNLPVIPEEPVNLGSARIKVNPEVITYKGLHSAAIEQTRSMVDNIRSKVAINKVLPDTCLLVKDEAFDGENKLYNAWVNPIYHTANIKKPVDIEADIWGVEAGFDIQANQNHKIGVFASYRQGEYDHNGKGTRYYSDVSSTINIDSYIGGLYYRYDYRHLWAFVTIYGGVQQADLKTNDGIKADADGTHVGTSLESGYMFNLSDTWKLEPSLGVFYTQIDFDDIKDNVGKTASYDVIRQTEIELGLKLEKYIQLDNGTAKVYIKPSVVQVMTSGDKVNITGLDKLSTYDDGTLGRIELGSRYAITNALSSYGYINYTFGSNYDATSIGIGFNYAW